MLPAAGRTHAICCTKTTSYLSLEEGAVCGTGPQWAKHHCRQKMCSRGLTGCRSAACSGACASAKPPAWKGEDMASSKGPCESPITPLLAPPLLRPPVARAGNILRSASCYTKKGLLACAM